MVSQSKIDHYLKKWEKAKKQELKNRINQLTTKAKTSEVIAEIKAIRTLLL